MKLQKQYKKLINIFKKLYWKIEKSQKKMILTKHWFYEN
jgi:hypothetical protein